MNGFLGRRFRLAERGTNVRTELLAGGTTFLTLSYILFVQPILMRLTGIPLDTALFATCVGSAFACTIMGIFADYPIALAPAMGHNVFFAFTACGAVAAGGFGLTWQQGLAAVFVSGSLFLGLSLLKFRERVIDAIPDSIKHAIAAGIGLLIALLGLTWGGIVTDHPVTLVQLGDLSSTPALLTLFGLVVTGAFAARRTPGALALGIAATAALGMILGLVPLPTRVVTTDLGVGVVLDRLDFGGLFQSAHVVDVLFVLFFLDLFDTVGTLVGVGARAGLLENGRLPRAGRALFADAAGTVVGAALGTSTITSYVESAAGVQAGGRTGLTALATGGLFLLALPFAPLIAVFGQAIVVDGHELHPVLAPTLVLVGCLMAKSAAAIEWDDPLHAIPSFLTLIVIPLSFSITDGIAFGFIAFAILSLATGRARECSGLAYLLALAFVARYAFL